MREARKEALDGVAQEDEDASFRRRLGEQLDLSATRVWGAGECLKKLGLQRETPLTLRLTPRPGRPVNVRLAEGGALAELEGGSASILSLRVQLREAEWPAVITLIAKPRARELAQEFDRGPDAQL